MRAPLANGPRGRGHGMIRRCSRDVAITLHQRRLDHFSILLCSSRVNSCAWCGICDGSCSSCSPSNIGGVIDVDVCLGAGRLPSSLSNLRKVLPPTHFFIPFLSLLSAVRSSVGLRSGTSFDLLSYGLRDQVAG